MDTLHQKFFYFLSCFSLLSKQIRNVKQDMKHFDDNAAIMISDAEVSLGCSWETWDVTHLLTHAYV